MTKERLPAFYATKEFHAGVVVGALLAVMVAMVIHLVTIGVMG